MKKIVLTAVLGLLPLPAMAAVTCEPLPSCDALGYHYNDTDCKGVSAVKCPFDQKKLFCNKTTKCESSQFYNVRNDTCVDGIDYCATIGLSFDKSSKQCAYCPSGEQFDPDEKECKEICNYNGYNDAIQTDNICTKVQVNNKTCYKCVPSNCGTGYANTANNIVYDSSNKAFAVIQDGQYYEPTIYNKNPGVSYQVLVDAMADGLVAPKKDSISAINAVSNNIAAYNYWLEEECQENGYSGHYAYIPSAPALYRCLTDSSLMTNVVALKKCICPRKATLESCDSTKYICEYEECTELWSITGCNTTYYDRSTENSSYPCPPVNNVEKCSADPSKYRCLPSTAAQACPFKATLTHCNGTKYLCELEVCSGKYFNRGCNTTYYDKDAVFDRGTFSYPCPIFSPNVEKCSENTLKYKCTSTLTKG